MRKFLNPVAMQNLAVFTFMDILHFLISIGFKPFPELHVEERADDEEDAGERE